MARGAVGLVLLGLAFASCIPRGSGGASRSTFTAEGYHNEKYPYFIKSVSGTPGAMSDAWLNDNFFGPSSDLRAKRKGIYSTTYQLDLDGDGQVDEKQDALTYDLRYVHRRHSGVIWVRTFPISQTLRDKELRVLMQDYIDSVAGAGYESVDFKDGTVVLEKRFAAELRGREVGKVAGKPAFAAEFAVANIDQLRVSSDARKSLVKVVIVSPGFVYAPRRYWASQDAKGPEFPVLLVLGLASAPEDFSRALPEFDDLLARVVVDHNSGVSLTRLDQPAPVPITPPADRSAAPAAPEVPASSAAP